MFQKENSTAPEILGVGCCRRFALSFGRRSVKGEEALIFSPTIIHERSDVRAQECDMAPIDNALGVLDLKS